MQEFEFDPEVHEIERKNLVDHVYVIHNKIERSRFIRCSASEMELITQQEYYTRLTDSDFTMDIIKAIKDNPNDQTLGAEVRQILNSFMGV